MSKGEKKADDAKKKAGGSAGKQFVPATKKGKVTKSHTKESKEMKISKSKLEQIIREEVERLFEEDFYEVDAIDVNEEYCPVCREAQELEEKKKKKKKKKACKPSKGKRFAKRVNGKCRSYGQAGQKKGGGDRIGKPGSKKANAYCALAFFIIASCVTTEWKPTTFYHQDNIQVTTPVKGEHVVVIYSTSWCYWCKVAKEWMKKHNITYVEFDYDDPLVKKKLKAFADSIGYDGRLDGVPIFRINNKLFVGYNPEQLLCEIGRSKCSTSKLFTTWETPLKQ